MRFLYFLALAFILYYVAKGVYRRFLTPPPASNPDLVRQAPSRRDLDYSKVKDANYRDVNE